MNRKTSKISYDRIKADALLGKLQFSVYDVLFNHGPLTQGEVWSRFLNHYQQHSVTPRFAELFERGVIDVLNERTCGYSGKLASAWDVTDRLPLNLPPKETAKQKIERLEKEVARLKRVNQNLADELAGR